MQVFVEKFDGLDIFIANGTDERSINFTSKVNVTNRNFTIPPTGKFFVQVQPAVGSQYGDYAQSIKFRYYQYNPNCAEFTEWNGSVCQPNYTAYCSNLTEQYRINLKNPDLLVYYNGSSCVISKDGIIQNTTID